MFLANHAVLILPFYSSAKLIYFYAFKNCVFCLLPCSTSVTIFFVLLLLLNRYLMVLLSLLFANYLGVLLLLLTVILWFCFRYCQSCCCYCLLPYSNAAVTACYLIVLLLCFHNIKPELSVELDRTLVIDLHNIGDYRFVQIRNIVRSAGVL